MINSAEEFIRLRCSENMEEYNRAAHDEAPVEVWETIIREHVDMRKWVAQNKKVPLSILDILSKDPSEEVRHMVARKRKLNMQIFERLAKDPDESVRLAIATNAKTPLDILKDLQTDEWEEIRIVAKNRCK